MPRYDLEGDALLDYRSAVAPPADLDDFWDRTITEARAASWPPKVEPVNCGFRVIDVFDVTFSGFAGEPIKAWYHRPAACDDDLPVVVRAPGYGGGRGLPHQVSQWPVAGYASLTIDARGQGSGWGWAGDTPDSGSFGPSGPGLLAHGILDPETYYFRRLYTDAVLAIDAVRQLAGVARDEVIVTGTSQGGGITLAVAGLVDGLSAIMPDVPFFCDVPRGMALSDQGPYLELVRHLGTHRQHEQRALEVLAYFDAAVLVRTASAPALFSVASMDHWCPPSTVYAAFNAYPGPKEIRTYPYNDHEGGQFHHEAEQLQWLPNIVPAAREACALGVPHERSVMSRIGVLSFSDGRSFVHEGIAGFVAEVEARVVAACRAAGHEVVKGTEPVTSNEVAVREARQLAAQRPDLTVFNYPVWAFPHFSVHAARATSGPLLLFSNIDPAYPGMVSMLAAGGSLDQLGRRHERLWGDITDATVAKSFDALARAAHAVRSLEGSTFGRIGGRSMGMFTAVGRTDEWMARFGIDVEEVDQWEIVRRSELVSAAQARAGRQWLEKHAAGVHYDANRLTPEILERQVRSYYALREIIDEGHLDFSGIKGQPELTNNFATTDIAEAFLNDPYDFDGPKAPHICATECDMDGALTMLLMHRVSATPVLFADVRHYFADRDIWDLENSGQHATWFAARSDDPAQNLAQVHLYPEEFYFPAGGASVHHLAAPGAMTLARLSRLDGRYRMQVTLGAFERFDAATNEALMRQSTYVWPHAFTRLAASAQSFLSRFGANHIHAVPGDITAQLAAICRFLDIDLDRLDNAAAYPTS